MLIASGGKLVAISERLSFSPYKVMLAKCDLRVNRSIRQQSSMLLNVHDAYEDGVLFTNLGFNSEKLDVPVKDFTSSN